MSRPNQRLVTATWDQCETLWLLAKLKAHARWRRASARWSTPRGMFAALAALLFVGVYVVGGAFLLSRREPADPRRLQQWLSGGMVLYTLYHLLKQLWRSPSHAGGVSGASTSRDRLGNDEDAVLSTAAEVLWIGGGPIERRLLVLREATSVMPATLVKTGLLLVVLSVDVPSIWRLAVGVFLSLLSVEWARRVLTTATLGMSPRWRWSLRGGATIAALALVVQLGCLTWFSTPPGSDPVVYALAAMSGVAEIAEGPAIQTLAMPLRAAAHLATGQTISWTVGDATFELGWLSLLAWSLVVPMGLAAILVHVDRWSRDRQPILEQAAWARLIERSGRRRERTIESRVRASAGVAALESLAARIGGDAVCVLAITIRQWHCVRKYAGNVIVSFAIPMALSLSPLLTDTTIKQGVFVIGGIALCSLLLAPPALQIDFRRDWKRVGLLRGLPVAPVAMCLGMLSMPVIITVIFQWSTLAIGAPLLRLPGGQVAWLAAGLPALAVVTFAIENALFLLFPHRPHDQGIAMVIRTKATFLWKAALLAACPAGLMLWSIACSTIFPTTLAPMVTAIGGLVLAWSVAAASVAVLVACWRRLDVSTWMPHA